MKLSPDDVKALDGVIKYARKREMFQCIIWCIFSQKKIEALVNGVKDGMSWRFAYERAKKLK
jgi:hypothetical protein